MGKAFNEDEVEIRDEAGRFHFLVKCAGKSQMMRERGGGVV